jgi:ABC-2 type transport system ATP-binding protein
MTDLVALEPGAPDPGPPDRGTPDPATPDPGTTDLAVHAQHLAKSYGRVMALNDVTLAVPKGSLFGLIGPNGAGKTTAMAIMASVVAPTSGRVLVLGLDPSEFPRELRKLLGYMPDALGVYEGLRVDEYLEFFAAAYRIPRAQWRGLVDGLLELVDLQVKRDALVDTLSRGMKQRLSLARALVHDPSVLILDEPASGLDPRARFELRSLLGELRAMGKTVVVSSHILAELEEMCTDVAIMADGRVLASGPPEEIRSRLQLGRTVTVHMADGPDETFVVVDDADQVALLHRLVADEQRPVLEFSATQGGLEDLFLRITEPPEPPGPGESTVPTGVPAAAAGAPADSTWAGPASPEDH